MNRQFLAVTLALCAEWASPQDNGQAHFSTTTNTVVVNVTVTGRDGKLIADLRKSDFLLYEDGKLQQLQTADYQRLESRPLPPREAALRRRDWPGPAVPAPEPATQSTGAGPFQDRRLIVLLFDFSSMAPAEQARARQAALQFVATRLTASDLVSVMTFGSELRTVQDFTADRDQLDTAIRNFRLGELSELAAQGDTGADAEDQSGAFVADETEFNIFNTDRKLAALEEAARRLAAFPEKKALVYLSSGVEKTGIENQSQLRATVNAAVRSNVAFYPIDARGLTALAPGGDATKAGAVGSGLFSGAGQRSVRDSFQNQQESLFTLASDTGGKALLDSNDLVLGIAQVQRDIGSYYVLTYSSSNAKEDGRYRRVQVKLAPGTRLERAKLDYRQGFYAPTTFAHRSETEKESELQRAFDSGNPITDLPLALEADYFRLEESKYFVALTVRIPGFALSFRKKGSRQATELDFIADVKDKQGHSAATVRDSIPLRLDAAAAGDVLRRQVQYDTGVTLTPGSYTLRLVARENGEGKTGTFESRLSVPDLSAASGLRLSSLVLSNQVQPPSRSITGVKNSRKLLSADPLVLPSGDKIVPNVTKVFRPGQKLVAFTELYDPTVPQGLPGNFRVGSVLASLAVYRGRQKVSESGVLRVNRLQETRPGVVPLQLQLPVGPWPQGSYTCQLSVIDELGRRFAFPRTTVVVLAGSPPVTATGGS